MLNVLSSQRGYKSSLDAKVNNLPQKANMDMRYNMIFTLHKTQSIKEAEGIF